MQMLKRSKKKTPKINLINHAIEFRCKLTDYFPYDKI